MATTSHCCDVQHRVVTRLHCSTIASDPTACQLGHVVAAADYSATECDDCRSQRPTRYLRCLTPSVEATSRRRMRTTLDQWSPLHSPTHRDYHWHRQQRKRASCRPSYQVVHTQWWWLLRVRQLEILLHRDFESFSCCATRRKQSQRTRA